MTTQEAAFAARVRAILDLPAWTQQRLGAEIGVTQPTISRWKRGRDPSFAHAKRFTALECRLLGVSEDVPQAAVHVIGVNVRRTSPKAPDLTSLVRFEWSGSLTPSAAAKVASIIADDMADRAFDWQPTGASS